MDVPDSKGSVQVGAVPEASHYEHLLNEVEATEGQLGAILRCAACPVQMYCYSCISTQRLCMRIVVSSRSTPAQY